MELEPNQTIYINNINEKVKKDVLKKQLYMLFSQYGKVKQIVACKGIKLRGQVYTFTHIFVLSVTIPHRFVVRSGRHGLCSTI